MAATPVLIPVEEYLRTVYRPDCDYIDGEVLERNVGETPHARLQGFFIRFFAVYEDRWSFEILPEQRLQVGPKNYRVPDVMLARLPNLDERIVRTVPLLCLEVLSSRDTMRELQKRINDYARIGVRACWVVDPWRGTAFAGGSDGILQPTEDRLTVPGTDIAIEVAAIWAELERLEKRAAKPTDN